MRRLWQRILCSFGGHPVKASACLAGSSLEQIEWIFSHQRASCEIKIQGAALFSAPKGWRFR